MKSKVNPPAGGQKLKVIWILTVLIIVYIVYKNISSSVFLKKHDRINLLFYGNQATFYSLGLNDVSYIIPFPVNLEVLVPGGYGKYRVGALGKLVSLEKNPDILKKAFSLATFTFIDLYFYPDKSTIYYQDITNNQLLPGWTNIFLTSSNANLVDRLLLFWLVYWNHPNQYKQIDNLPTIKDNNRIELNIDAFNQRYQGYFYKRAYRQIKDNVQILYSKSYKTALLLSQIIEGEGIRVVDISQNSKVKSQNSECLITQKRNTSIVAADLQKFFNCQKKVEEPTVSDIIIELRDLEKEWLVE